MATNKPTLSHVLVQSHALAAVRVWVALKAACGHSRPYFGNGPAALPVEPVVPRCSILPGKEEVRHEC